MIFSGFLGIVTSPSPDCKVISASPALLSEVASLFESSSLHAVTMNNRTTSTPTKYKRIGLYDFICNSPLFYVMLYPDDNDNHFHLSSQVFFQNQSYVYCFLYVTSTSKRM